MIRILIADDHILLTDSLRMVLESFEGIEIVGTAHDGQEAVDKSIAMKPDIVLMDIKMPLLGGVEAAGRIKKKDPDIKIIILTSLEESRYVWDAFLNGVDAYLLKDTPPERLKTLIQCVYWGFYVMSGSSKNLLLSEYMHAQDNKKVSGIVDALKEEEIAMIRSISEGKNNNEIAEIFGYANGTVKNKITHLLEITETGNRAQLVMFALSNNLL